MTRLQCRHCPWKTTTNPHDIPNGYCETKHRKLKETIAQPGHVEIHTLRMMACHETHAKTCVGWMPGSTSPTKTSEPEKSHDRPR